MLLQQVAESCKNLEGSAGVKFDQRALISMAKPCLMVILFHESRTTYREALLDRNYINWYGSLILHIEECTPEPSSNYLGPGSR